MCRAGRRYFAVLCSEYVHELLSFDATSGPAVSGEPLPIAERRQRDVDCIISRQFPVAYGALV